MYKTSLLTLAAIGLMSLVQAQAQTQWIDVDLTDHTYFTSDSQYREEFFDIHLPAGRALEFKLRMETGDIIVYSWTASTSGDGAIEVEFHGHTEPAPGEPGEVMYYSGHGNLSERGALKAPFSGVQGWYMNNRSDQEIRVHLHVAGFFEVEGY